MSSTTWQRLKNNLKLALIVTATVISIIVAVFVYFWISEYRPQPIEEITPLSEGRTIEKDTLSILSWNIGYAGYEDSMDFFYDGGTRVQTTKENAKNNLREIISSLKRYRDVDFILLQEVDIKSKRSYEMNMLDSLKSALPEFSVYYAPNFRCKYVPIPVFNPVGKVESGLVLMTKYKPTSVRRHQLPGSFSFPTRIFNLKRCLLEASFSLPSGDTLWIVNLHNSAFDDGSMRRQEIEYIRQLSAHRKYSFLCGDWNSTPPGYSPSKEEITNQYFSPIKIDTCDLSGLKFTADLNSHTMRYLYEPYKKGITTESLIDFGVFTTGILSISTKTLEDQRYSHSDHNPVLYRIAIDSQESESR